MRQLRAARVVNIDDGGARRLTHGAVKQRRLARNILSIVP